MSDYTTEEERKAAEKKERMLEELSAKRHLDKEDLRKTQESGAKALIRHLEFFSKALDNGNFEKIINNPKPIRAAITMLLTMLVKALLKQHAPKAKDPKTLAKKVLESTPPLPMLTAAPKLTPTTHAPSAKKKHRKRKGKRPS